MRAEAPSDLESGKAPGALPIPCPESVVFRAVEGGVEAAGTELAPAVRFRMRASGKAAFRIGDRRYAGGIEIERDGDGLRVINALGLEAYLRGVVGGEMPASWEVEALKAQAVAARTYAVARRRDARVAGAPFDLLDDTRSQVYGGVPSGSFADRISEAVSSTAGQVLGFRGKAFTAYFHSTCGGHTESAERIFGTDRGIGPLEGAPCGFCEGSPTYRWEARLPRAEVEAALGVEGIRSVRAVDPGPSGRCLEVTVEGAGGEKVLSSMEFRRLLGYAVLKSTAFTAEFEGDDVLFRGTGFGHGVGMCQWGARGMARAGRNAEAILQRYYPGASIGTMEASQR
jgi:stage II sporulation protein D